MLKKNDGITAYLFLMPALLLFLAFNAIPMLYSIYLSLIEWDGFSPEKRFVGLNNYFSTLSNPSFYHSFFVTLIYTLLVTLFSIIIGLVVAVLLNGPVLFKSLFRTFYFIPVVTATAAAGIVWRYLLDPSQGIVNKYLNLFFLPSVPWLTDPFWVVISIAIVGVWKRIGFNLVIYLAALQGISTVYYEAAEIDGANTIEKFWYITIPLLKPTTLLLVVMSFIDSFQIFDQVYVMTNGGPLGASDVLGLYMYREGFNLGHLGIASSLSWIIFFVIFTATLIQFRVANKGDELQ